MNASLSPSAPPPRVPPNLGRAFGGIWRLTVHRFLLPGHWLMLAGMLLLLLPFSAPAVHNVEAAKHGFFPWLITFYLTFLVPVLSFISAAGTMRDEMKSGTVDYVFTRPIPRWAFVLFKYLSHVACTQVDFLCALGVAFLIGSWREVPGLGDAFPSLLGTQFLVVMAFSAMGILAAVATSRYIIVGLVYGAVIEVGVGQIPTQLNRLSMTHQVRAMLHDLMATGRPAIPSPDAIPLPVAGVLATTTLLIAFTIVMLAVAAAVFSFLELVSADES